jgi:hypothetical protein
MLANFSANTYASPPRITVSVYEDCDWAKIADSNLKGQGIGLRSVSVGGNQLDAASTPKSSFSTRLKADAETVVRESFSFALQEVLQIDKRHIELLLTKFLGQLIAYVVPQCLGHITRKIACGNCGRCKECRTFSDRSFRLLFEGALDVCADDTLLVEEGGILVRHAERHF